MAVKSSRDVLDVRVYLSERISRHREREGGRQGVREWLVFGFCCEESVTFEQSEPTKLLECCRCSARMTAMCRVGKAGERS